MNLNPMLSNNVLGLGGSNAFPPSIMIPPSNPEGLFCLYAGGSTSVSDGCYPFYKNGVKYQVTAGMKFKARALILIATSSGMIAQLVSATAAFSINDDGATLTGPVWQCGADGRVILPVTAGSTPNIMSITYEFGAQTWPGVQFSTSAVGGCILIGKEEA